MNNFKHLYHYDIRKTKGTDAVIKEIVENESNKLCQELENKEIVIKSENLIKFVREEESNIVNLLKGDFAKLEFEKQRSSTFISNLKNGTEVEDVERMLAKQLLKERINFKIDELTRKESDGQILLTMLDRKFFISETLDKDYKFEVPKEEQQLIE